MQAHLRLKLSQFQGSALVSWPEKVMMATGFLSPHESGPEMRISPEDAVMSEKQLVSSLCDG